MVKNKEAIQLWIEVTSTCNYNCFFCYNHFQSISKKGDSIEITKDNFSLLLATILENYTIFIICFSGGEPLLRKDIDELLEISSHYCNNIIIATNGSEIHRINIEQIIKKGCNYFQIPLLGSTPESHDKVSGITGSFEKVIQGLLILKSFEIATTIIFIWNHKNNEHLMGILEISYLLGIKSIIINEMRVAPNIITHLSRNEILEEKKAFISSLKKIDKYAQRLGIELIIPTYVPHSTFKHLKFGNSEFTFSKTEVKRLFIDSRGFIKRCAASTSSFGSIYSIDFNAELKTALRNCNEITCLF